MTDLSAWRDASNPVLPGFHPDPSVCRVDGPDGTWYYVVNSTFEYLPGIPVHRSRDLVSWEHVGHVITDQLDYTDVRDSGGLYAPTIRHDGTRFLVVCTHLAGPGRQGGNFVVTAQDAAGPWSQPVWWPESEGVDPSLLLDDDGRIWAHGARGAHVPQWPNEGEVWVREVDPATLELVGPEVAIWNGALIGSEWTEGPHLYRRGQYVYLLAAEGGTGRHHAVTVARALSPTGPFEACTDNPVLTHRTLGPQSVVVNVGHADLVEAPDGTWWALCLASRLADGVDLLGRETFLLPVQWHDDWPVFAPGTATLVPEPGGPSGVTRQAGAGEPWLAVRRPPAAVAAGTGAGGDVTLRAGAGLAASEPAFLGRRLRHLAAEVSLALADVGPWVTASPEREVGLAVRQSSTQWVSAGVRAGDDGTVELVVTQCVDGAAAVVTRPPVAGQGTLSVRIGGRRAEVLWQPAGAAQTQVTALDVAHLGTTHAGWFVGCTYGAYALATSEEQVVVGQLSARSLEQ
ncbi:glycoside hydrolase family 43 protein [Cellulomonas fengjieae]|uniref:glycoside hydrolase family 43 protein n=1 Tax=Cellulomonas fengjieae TaxID=2819978 RepID=UPI001AAF1A6D|nr:glycoside hydrolase family 43 protein [Cellulomonas fengjieae]MBO3101511.1 family 43 glycosylhydrolase [Cellulomonas fengjieae]